MSADDYATLYVKRSVRMVKKDGKNIPGFEVYMNLKGNVSFRVEDIHDAISVLYIMSNSGLMTNMGPGVAEALGFPIHQFRLVAALEKAKQQIEDHSWSVNVNLDYITKDIDAAIETALLVSTKEKTDWYERVAAVAPEHRYLGGEDVRQLINDMLAALTGN